MSHYLVILEPGVDYDIEHPPECPTSAFWTDPDGAPIMLHTCLLGTIVHEAGLEPLDGAPEDDWRSLGVGRYLIEAWTQHSPSGPWGPEEWDNGIMLVEEKG